MDGLVSASSIRDGFRGAPKCSSPLNLAQEKFGGLKPNSWTGAANRNLNAKPDQKSIALGG